MTEDVSCYTIISKDVPLLEWCVNNARQRAGMDHSWHIIGWEPTDEVRKWCEGEDIPIHCFTPKPKKLFADHTSWFLHSLYCAWNLGYSVAKTKWVARMGSDQFFSDAWLLNLMEAAGEYGERGIYHTWTVESPAAVHSRHPIRDWGDKHGEFNVRQFDLYADDLIHRVGNTKAEAGNMCELFYNHPARGKQRRPDGVTWLQTKKLWDEFGPMENVLNHESVTGDVAYMDRMYDAGVQSWLVNRSVSYHLVQGETRQEESRVI